MKKFLLLLLIPLSSYGASGLGGVPISAVPPLLNPGSTPSVIYPVYTTYSITNKNYFGYGQIISNSVVSVTGVDGVGFTPVGGNYYGLTVTNSYLISSTNEQAAMGFSESITYSLPTNAILNFYDGAFYGSGSNGDAVSWKEPLNAPTNEINFYNSQFIAPNYAFNQVGSRSTFRFYNCLWEATGPSWQGGSFGFLPDQGPVTNVITGGNIVARNSDVNCGLLVQIKSYNTLNGVVFDISNTNSSATTANTASDAYGYANHQLQNVAIGWSGEGDYYAICNGCTFHFSGAGTNYVTDFEFLQVAGGVRATLVLNNCYWYGATGPVVVQNSIAENGGTQPTIIVSGGNFTPANFSTMAGVTFTNYSPATNFSAASAGTIYTMTATPALLDFGTTDPSTTINQTGTYIIYANASFETRGATYAATNAVTIKVRRTNNTAADIAGATKSSLIPIMTTISGPLNDITIPLTVYTATAGDILQLWGGVQATPSAGSVACDSADIIAIRVY